MGEEVVFYLLFLLYQVTGELSRCWTFLGAALPWQGQLVIRWSQLGIKSYTEALLLNGENSDIYRFGFFFFFSQVCVKSFGLKKLLSVVECSDTMNINTEMTN